MLVSSVLVCGKKALFTTDKKVDDVDEDLSYLSVIGGKTDEDESQPTGLIKYNPSVETIGVIIFKTDLDCMKLNGFDEITGLHFINPTVLKPLAEMREFLDK